MLLKLLEFLIQGLVYYNKVINFIQWHLISEFSVVEPQSNIKIFANKEFSMAVGTVQSKGMTENGYYINGNKLATTLMRKTLTTSLHQT